MSEHTSKMTGLTDSLPLRTRKPRGQGASRRGEILTAAKRLFTEEGFAHATMRRIAAEVGVSPTALYLHFADKDAILKAIAEDFFAELLERLRQANRADEPGLANLRRGMRSYIETGLERSDEYQLTFMTSTARPGYRHCDPIDLDHPTGADLSFAVLEHAVAEQMAAGVFRPGCVRTMAEALWCCLHGATSALITMSDRMYAAREDVIESVIETAIRGCMAK